MLPLLAAALIPAAHADDMAIANVTAMTTKASGEAWDAMGGAPDAH